VCVNRGFFSPARPKHASHLDKRGSNSRLILVQLFSVMPCAITASRPGGWRLVPADFQSYCCTFQARPALCCALWATHSMPAAGLQLRLNPVRSKFELQRAATCALHASLAYPSDSSGSSKSQESTRPCRGWSANIRTTSTRTAHPSLSLSHSHRHGEKRATGLPTPFW
jgi:hypothetical protein